MSRVSTDRLENANRERRDDDSRYALYERLRTESGVIWTSPLTVVTDFALASAVLHDPELFTSNVLEIQADVMSTKVLKWVLQTRLGAAMVDPIPAMMDLPVIFANGDDHRRARAAIAPAMRPALIEPISQEFASLARHLVAKRSRTGSLDVVKDIAIPMSTRVVSSLFGIDARHDQWIRRQLRPTSGQVRAANLADGLRHAPAMAMTQRHLRKFFFEVVLNGEESERTPLLTAVKRRQRDDGPTVAMAEFIQLLVGGTDTTENLITNGVRRLVDDPSLADGVRNGSVPMAAFRQEVLRHDSPPQVLFRLTQDAVKLGEVDVPSHHRVALVLGAANRDPEVFSDPAVFDTTRFDAVGRPVGPKALAAPLSFGEGIHACPGFYVAGAEADAVWNIVLDELDGLSRPDANLRTTSGLASNGLASLPIRFDPITIETGPEPMGLSGIGR